MRSLGLVLAGMLGGACTGIVGGFLLVYVWLQLLGLPPLNDDPKRLATIAAFVLPSMALCAILFPIWLVRRDRRGRPVWPILLLLGLGTLPTLLFWSNLLR